MKTVEFYVLLSENANAGEIRARLEELAKEAKGEMRFGEVKEFRNQGLKYITGTTIQCTYETVFCTLLDYDESSNEWKTKTESMLPEFKGKVLHVEVKRKL